MMACIVLGAALAALPQTADSPAMAVVMASVGRGPAAAARLDIPAGAFASLPRPGPGIAYVAEQRHLGRQDVFRVRVTVVRRGRKLDEGVFNFRWVIGRSVAVVATKHLAKGEHITADMVELRRYSGPRDGPRFVSAERVVGMVARYEVLAGTVLTPSVVRRPHAVKRGQRVRVIVRSGGLVVSVGATAMGSGSVGERIRVSNDRSRKVFDAIVVAQGRAEVSLP